MSRAVLISIQPKWCELIASGKKTVEVRKTKPKLQTPFKCYIYCTNGKEKLWVLKEIERAFTPAKIASICAAKDVGGTYQANGKVIGEFVCDRIDTYDDDTIHAFSHEDYSKWNDFDLENICIHPEDFERYANDNWLYGWHISNLIIYDKPKELREFYRHDISYDNSFGGYFEDRDKRTPITRPPQSWCYVEEV